MIARAFAVGALALGLAACDGRSLGSQFRSVTSSAGNPLLQTREGRREIVTLCQDAVRERLAETDTARFARGQIVNEDDYGEARYHGAVESLAGNASRRMQFICTVQPSGEVEVMFR